MAIDPQTQQVLERVKVRQNLRPSNPMTEIRTAQGVAFFMAKTEAFYANCKMCDGTCETRERDTLREEGFRRNGDPVKEPIYRMVHCPACWSYTSRMRDFCQTFFQAVPPRYQNCIWSQLKPSDKSVVPLDRQREIMDDLKANSDQSVAFFGPPGTSKTTWMTAMYAQSLWRATAYEQGQLVVSRYTAKAMLDQFTQWQLHGADPDTDAMPPRMSRERIVKITRNGGRFSIFLEEVDKVKPTEARISNLFEVVDALYENLGQLVFNSNLTPQEFQSQFGSEFARRISEMCKIENLF